MPLPQDPLRQAQQEQADAERLVAQQQRAAERLANAQAKQLASEQEAAAKAARKSELSKQELDMRAKGMIPVTTADGSLHPDPLWEQKQAEKAAKEQAAAAKAATEAKAAQISDQYTKEGRKFFESKVTGLPVALESDAQLEQQRKDRAEKARRDALDERVRAIETATSDPAKKRLPTTARTQLTKQLAKTQQEALFALQGTLQEQAKAVSGGADFIPFNEAATPEALAAQERLARLSQPDAQLTEEDLAALEANDATKPQVKKLRNIQSLLAKDDEAAQFHESQAATAFDLKLRRDDPAAWTERQRQRRANMSPQELQADLEASAADLTTRGQSLNEAFAPIQARRAASQQKLTTLTEQAAQRRQQGLTAGEMVTMTAADGTTETWPADLAAEFEKEQALAQQSEAQDAPILERIIAQRDELLTDESLHNEASTRLAEVTQANQAQQATAANRRFAFTPGMEQAGPELEALASEAQTRQQVLADMHPDGIPQEALDALQSDMQAKTEAIITAGEARLQGASKAAAQIRQRLDTREFEGKDASPAYAEAAQQLAQQTGTTPEEAQRLITDAESATDWSNTYGRHNEEAAPGPTRLLSNGGIVVNPSITDKAAYEKAVAASGGTPEAQADAIARYPQVREAAARQVLESIQEIGSVFGDDAIADYAAHASKRPQDVSEAEWAMRFVEGMKAQANTGMMGRTLGSITKEIWTSLNQGAIDLRQQASGLLGGLLGDESLLQDAQWAGRKSEALQQVKELGGDQSSNVAASAAFSSIPRLAGSILPAAKGAQAVTAGVRLFAGTSLGARFLPSLAARIAGSATPAQAASAVQTLTRAGLGGASAAGAAQTYGAQIADIYSTLRRQQPELSHTDALQQAQAPAIISALATAALTTLGGSSGVERLFTRPQEARAVFDKVFASRLQQAGFVGKEFLKGGLKESFLEELPDEMISQIAAAVGTGKPVQQALAEFLQQLPELALATTALGGAGQGIAAAMDSSVNPDSSKPEVTAPAWAAIESHVAAGATGQPDPTLTEQQQRRAALALSLAQGGELFDIEAPDLAAAGWTRDGDKFKPLKDYTGPQVLDIDQGGLPVIKDSYIAALRQTGLAPVADAIGMTETQTRNFYAQRNKPTTAQNTPAGSQQPQQSGNAPTPAGSRPNANQSPVQTPSGTGNEPPRSGANPPPPGNAVKAAAGTDQWFQELSEEELDRNIASVANVVNNAAVAATQDGGDQGFADIAKLAQERLGRLRAEKARRSQSPSPPVSSSSAAPATVADTLANHLTERGLDRPAAQAAAEEIAARPEFDGMSYEAIIAEGPKFRAALDDLGIAGSLNSKDVATNPLQMKPGGRLEKVKAEMESKAAKAKEAAASGRDPFETSSQTPANLPPGIQAAVTSGRAQLVGGRSSSSPDFTTLRQKLQAREISDRDASRQVAEAVGATTPEAFIAAMQQHLGWKPLRAEIASHSHFGTKDQSSIPMASAGRASNRTVNQVTPVNQVTRDGPDLSLAADPSPLRKNRAYAADKLRVLARIKDPSKKAWARQFFTALEQSLQRHHLLYDAYAVGGPARRHLDGQMTAVLEVEGKITRLIDLDAMVAQFDYLQSPQDALRATSIEEDIHASVLQLAREKPEEYGYNALRQKWQALPAALQQTVWQAYRAANQTTASAAEATMPKLTPVQEWHMMNEFLRMLVQDASFAGAITETVDTASGLIGWVQDLLKNLSRLLKNLMKKVQPDLRANLDRMVAQISARLAQVEQASAAQKDRLAALPSLRDPAAYASTILQQIGTAENAGILSNAALARVFDQLDPALQSRAFADWKTKNKEPGTKNAPKDALMRSLLAQFLGSRRDSQRLATALAGTQAPPKTTSLLTKIMDRLLDRVQAPEILDLLAAQSPSARRDLKNLHIATLRAIGGIRAASFVHDLGTKSGLVTTLEAPAVNPVIPVNEVPSESAERRRADFLAALASREQDHEDARNDENQLQLRQRLYAEESANPVLEGLDEDAKRSQQRLADFLAALDEWDRQIDLDHRDASTPSAGPALRRKLRQEELAYHRQLSYLRGEALAQIQQLTDQRRLPEPTKRLLFDLMQVAAGRFEGKRPADLRLAGFVMEQSLQRLGLRITERGTLVTTDPLDTAAYVERRHIILRQETLDTVADLAPAVAAFLHFRLGSEYDQRQKHNLPTFSKPTPQLTDEVESDAGTPARTLENQEQSTPNEEPLPTFTPLAPDQSPFAANTPPAPSPSPISNLPSPVPSARIPLGGRNSLPAQFATAEDLAAFQYQLDRDALLREGTPEKDRNAARDRITALRARLIDETGASKEEVEQKLADYHRAVIDAAKKADPVEVFRPVSFSNFLRARGTQAKADTLVAPEGGDLISALQGRVKRIGKISQSRTAGEWDWYRQLQQQVQAENAGRPLSRRQLQQAQKAAQNGDVSTPLNLLQWINLNVVDADKGMPIDEAASALSDTGKLDENDPNAQQPFDVDGTSLGDSILAAIDARVALRDQGGDPALRQEAEALRQGSDFRAVAEGAPGRAFTGSELAARLQPGDEIQLGTEWLTVTDVDTEEGTVALDSDRYGPQGLEPSQTIHLLAIGDESFPVSPPSIPSTSPTKSPSGTPTLEEARAELRAALLEAGIQPLPASQRIPEELRFAQFVQGGSGEGGGFVTSRVRARIEAAEAEGREEIPAGGHGSLMVWPDEAAFVRSHGFGRSHLNTTALAVYQSAKAGSEAAMRYHADRLIEELTTELGEDPATARNTADELLQAARNTTPSKLAASQRLTPAEVRAKVLANLDTPLTRSFTRGEKAWLMPDGQFAPVDDHYEILPYDENGEPFEGWMLQEAGIVRIEVDLDDGFLYADHSRPLTSQQKQAVRDTAIERGLEYQLINTARFIPQGEGLASSPRIRAAAATYADRAFTERGKRTFPDFLAFVAGDLPDFFPYLKTPHLRSAWNTLMAEKSLPEVTAAEEATALRPYAPRIINRPEPDPETRRRSNAATEESIGLPAPVSSSPSLPVSSSSPATDLGLDVEVLPEDPNKKIQNYGSTRQQREQAIDETFGPFAPGVEVMDTKNQDGVILPHIMRGRGLMLAIDGQPHVAMRQVALPSLGTGESPGVRFLPLAGDKSNWTGFINQAIQKAAPDLDQRTDYYLEPYGGGLVYLQNLDVLLRTQKPVIIASSQEFEPDRNAIYNALREGDPATLADLQTTLTDMTHVPQTDVGRRLADLLFGGLQNRTYFAASAEAAKQLPRLAELLRRPNVQLKGWNDVQTFDLATKLAQSGKRVTLLEDSNYADLPGEETEDQYASLDAGPMLPGMSQGQITEFIGKNPRKLLAQKLPIYRAVLDAGGTVIATNNMNSTLLNGLLAEFGDAGHWFGYAHPTRVVPDGWMRHPDGKGVLWSNQRPEYLAILQKGVVNPPAGAPHYGTDTPAGLDYRTGPRRPIEDLDRAAQPRRTPSPFTGGSREAAEALRAPAPAPEPRRPAGQSPRSNTEPRTPALDATLARVPGQPADRLESAQLSRELDADLRAAKEFEDNLYAAPEIDLADLEAQLQEDADRFLNDDNEVNPVNDVLPAAPRHHPATGQVLPASPRKRSKPFPNLVKPTLPAPLPMPDLFGEWAADIGYGQNWRRDEPLKLIGFRGVITPGRDNGFGNTEGNGIYLMRKQQEAAVFGKVQRISFPEPQRPFLVTNDDLYLLNESEDLDLPIDPAKDSPWLQASKYAAQLAHNLGKGQWNAQLAGDILTKFLMEGGYDSVYVQGMPDDWVVLLRETRPGQKPLKALPASNRRVEYVEPGFYSALAEAIRAKMPVRSTPATILGILKNAGLKQEELKWTGIVPWLQAQAQDGPITQQQVLDYLATEGSVKFTITRLRDERESPAQLQLHDRYRELSDQLADLKRQSEEGIITNDQAVAEHRRITQERDTLQSRYDALKTPHQKTRNTQWTLPGGINPKEVVVTWRQTPNAADLAPGQAAKMSRQELIQWYRTNIFDDIATDATEQDVSTARLRELYISNINLREQNKRPSLDKPVNSPNDIGDTTHYGDLDALAWYRTTDRTNAAGPGLLVEEFQSKWHQRGREEGYKYEVEEWQAFYNTPAGAEVPIGYGNTAEAALANADPSWKGLVEIKTRKTGTVVEGAIPDAPYSTAWPLMLFKRALRDAVEAGKSWIGWTTGDTQADRYDLSKKIKTVRYYWDGAPDPHGQLIALNLEGQTVLNQREVAPDKLAEYIGKEPADKLLAAPNQQGMRELSGLDLRVGGEGMRKFYDDILVKEFGKYVKQWGGKVEQASITTQPVEMVDVPRNPRPNGPAFVRFEAVGRTIVGIEPSGARVQVSTVGGTGPLAAQAEQIARQQTEQYNKALANSETPIHRITITPAMRESVARGQPLFASTRLPVAPQLDLRYTPLTDGQDPANARERSNPLQENNLGGGLGANAQNPRQLRQQTLQHLNWAKEQGWLIDPADLDERLSIMREIRAGDEHDVWHDELTDRAVKLTRLLNGQPFYASGSLSAYLQNLRQQNELFGTGVAFEGIVEDEGQPRIVTSMPWVRGTDSEQAAKEAYFKAHGFDAAGDDTFYSMGRDLLISDARPVNVLQREDGTVQPIDIQVRDVSPRMAEMWENRVNARAAGLAASTRSPSIRSTPSTTSAVAAAAALTDPNPSPAQKRAGNYTKGKVDLHGLRISIENPAGSVRSGTDAHGKPWSVTLPHHYGYILGSEGRDGDHVDVFIGPNPDSQLVLIVNQRKPGNGHFDEHKVMLGFNTPAEAARGYLASYSKGWQGLQSAIPTTIPVFNHWLTTHDTTLPVTQEALTKLAKSLPLPSSAHDRPTNPPLPPTPTPPPGEALPASLRQTAAALDRRLLTIPGASQSLDLAGKATDLAGTVASKLITAPGKLALGAFAVNGYLADKVGLQAPLATFGSNNLDKRLAAQLDKLAGSKVRSYKTAVETWLDKPEGLAPTIKGLVDQVLPTALIPREWLALHHEMQRKTAYGQETANDLIRALSGNPRLSDLAYPKEFAENPAARAQLFDAMENKIPMSSLPPEMQRLGQRLRDLLRQTGSELVRQGLMNPDTFEELQANGWMPRYTEDEARESAGSFLAAFKLGVRDLLQQRSTAYHIVDTTRKDKTGQYVTVSRDEGGKRNRWRFRDAASRDAFYHQLIRQHALTALQEDNKHPHTKTLLDALDAKTRREVRADIKKLTPADLELTAKVSPAVARLIKSSLHYQADRFLPKDPFEPAKLVKDPVYAVARYVLGQTHNASTMELLRKTATHPEWVSDVSLTGFTAIPDASRFGPLAGKHVRKDIAAQILDLVDVPNAGLQFYDAILRKWKAGKLVWNPGSHVRDAVGNTMFAYLAGSSIWNPGNWLHYQQAIAALRSGGPAFAELIEQQVIGGDAYSGLVKERLRGLLPDPKTVEDYNPGFVQRMLFGFGATLHGSHEFLSSIRRLPDDLFKAAAYFKAKADAQGEGLAKPLAEQRAAAHVRKWFPYYDRLGQSGTTRAIGRFVNPFVSFFRESTRILGTAVVERPLALTASLAFPALVTAVSAMLLGLDEDDLEEIKKDMAGKGKLFATDTPLFSMLLPFRSAQGAVQQFDISAIMPFADLLGTRVAVTDATEDPWNRFWRGIVSGGPVLSLVDAWRHNEDAFTRRPIAEFGMTPLERITAYAKHAAGVALPPLAPGGSAFNTLTRAGERSTNKTLETYDPTQAVIRSVAGLNVKNATPDLYRQAHDFVIAQGGEIQEGMDYGSTTPASRARAALYGVLTQDNPNPIAIKNLLASLEKMGHPIRTDQDINKLLFYRNPLMVVGAIKKKGLSASEAQARFRASLTGESRAALEAALQEFQRIKANAPRLIRAAQ